MRSAQASRELDGKCRFFCVEGVDGVGKSSAVRLAAARRADFVAMKTPPERMGSLRRFYDKNSCAEARFFFYLSAVAEQSNEIRAALSEKNVCCDRYLLSTIAYHSVMCRKHGLERYFALAEEMGLAIPDRNIVLLADAKTRIGRLNKRVNENGEKTSTDLDIELTELVQSEYLRIAEAGFCVASFIDTSKLGVEEVVERVLAEFEK